MYYDYAIYVKPLNDYKLQITYINGEVKEVDLKNEIFKYDVWKPLRDENIFNKVYIDHGACPCWDYNEYGELDMDPDDIYKKGKLIEINKNVQSFRFEGRKDYAMREKDYYTLYTDKYAVELEMNATFYEDCIIINFEQEPIKDFFDLSWEERHYVTDNDEDIQFIAKKFEELINNEKECKFYDLIHNQLFDIYFVSNGAADINSYLQKYLEYIPIEFIYD